MLTSYINGTEDVYFVYMDSDGSPSIDLKISNPTDEPNGVKISIPIADSDMADICRYVNTLSLLSGIPIDVGNELEPILQEIEKGFYSVVGNMNGLYDKGYLYVRMGCIVYQTKISVERSSSYVVDIPIGSLDITPSRDTIIIDEKYNYFANVTFPEMLKKVTESYLKKKEISLQEIFFFVTSFRLSNRSEILEKFGKYFAKAKLFSAMGKRRQESPIDEFSPYSYCKNLKVICFDKETPYRTEIFNFFKTKYSGNLIRYTKNSSKLNQTRLRKMYGEDNITLYMGKDIHEELKKIRRQERKERQAEKTTPSYETLGGYYTCENLDDFTHYWIKNVGCQNFGLNGGKYNPMYSPTDFGIEPENVLVTTQLGVSRLLKKNPNLININDTVKESVGKFQTEEILRMLAIDEILWSFETRYCPQKVKENFDRVRKDFQGKLTNIIGTSKLFYTIRNNASETYRKIHKQESENLKFLDILNIFDYYALYRGVSEESMQFVKEVHDDIARKIKKVTMK